MDSTDVVLFMWGNSSKPKSEEPYKFKVCVEGNNLDMIIPALESTLISFPQTHTVKTYNGRVLVFCASIINDDQTNAKRLRFSFGETERNGMKITKEEVDVWRKTVGVDISVTDANNEQLEFFLKKKKELDDVIQRYKTSEQMRNNFDISEEELRLLGDEKWFARINRNTNRKEVFFRLYKELEKVESQINSFRRLELNKPPKRVICYRYLVHHNKIKEISKDDAEAQEHTMAFINHVKRELSRRFE